MATSTEAVAVDASTAGLQAVELKARLRLLQSLASRGSSEIAAVCIPPAVLAVHWKSTSEWSGLLGIWWGLMAFMALGLTLLRKHLRQQWAVQGHAPLQRQDLIRWERQLAVAGWINGLCWSSVIALSWGLLDSELRLFVYLVLAGVLASGTTFLAPVPLVFGGFFAGIYLPMLLAALGYFPHQGVYLFPLLLLYGAVLLRHAWGSRRFVQEQMAHERERHILAERYRAAKVEAENALAEKNWFFSAASHDLRQPLHALGLMLEAARQRNRSEEVALLLSDVQTCTRDLGGMFNDLLDLSRLESGTLVPKYQRVDLALVFEEARRMFAHDAAQRGIRLSMRLPRDGVALMETDPVLLRQMVFNLLQNALRYTERGGVLLALRRRQGQWLIQVWDSGAGIAKAELPRIFSAHYRTTEAQTMNLRGRGLGLSVVALAAQRMEVAYGVESRQGRGSCFWLLWPAKASVALPEARVQPWAVAPRKMDALQGACLVVENEALLGQAMLSLLLAWGMEARWVRSAEDAGQLLATGWRPDFVLCDQQLGEGEPGLALLQRLLEQYPEASGALMSADPAALDAAQEEGYLTLPKPLQPQALHAVLMRCLSA